ncbi:MAG: NADH:flavin oxidoreductase/NADH oxidase [Burkholderiaceae bacterium]
MLLSPFSIRHVEMPNRVVVSPMAQYSALDGLPGPHHSVHYGSLAKGGAGMVMVESTGVSAHGRITNGCLGMYTDEQRDAFKPIVNYMHECGTMAAIQLGHGGRKASMQRPWEGNGPMTEANVANGDKRWQPVGASALPLDDGWPTPTQMDQATLRQTADDFAKAARRSLDAGFDIIEVHMAHGYLLQSFLSPLSNKRTDAYGGSRENMMRFPLEVVAAVREEIGTEVPLFARISCIDAIDGGWEIHDSVAFAHALKTQGVDVVDCSSGGNSPKGATNSNLKRGPGFQVPFAETIRRETGIMTQAVGLIRNIAQAQEILDKGQADLIAIGRDFLYNPLWLLHQVHQANQDPDFENWPTPYAWWLEKWDKGIKSTRNT